MRLTRKQLNQILVQLPDPRLVIGRRIPSTYQVPVYNPMEDLNKVGSELVAPAPTIRKLTFEFSYSELDWVLTDLVL